MTIVFHQIDLRTNDNAHVLRMAGIKKHDEGHGLSGYSCDLLVQSRGFSCQTLFCFDDTNLVSAMDALRKMDKLEVCEAIIKYRYEHDYLSFRSDELGHIYVTGELNEYSETPQLFRFGFRTDQTVLGPLIRDFDAVLAA